MLCPGRAFFYATGLSVVGVAEPKPKAEGQREQTDEEANGVAHRPEHKGIKMFAWFHCGP